ncbi:uncharacterized protein LOC100178527 isoform X2 [Ciona intestinalis]
MFVERKPLSELTNKSGNVTSVAMTKRDQHCYVTAPNKRHDRSNLRIKTLNKIFGGKNVKKNLKDEKSEKQILMEVAWKRGMTYSSTSSTSDDDDVTRREIRARIRKRMNLIDPESCSDESDCYSDYDVMNQKRSRYCQGTSRNNLNANLKQSENFQPRDVAKERLTKTEALGSKSQLKLVVCGSTNKITITILGLRSLPNTSSNNNQVYVKMSLSPEFESRLRHKTSTYDVTEESIAMHETFSFDICRRDSNRRVLVSVWMKNNERTFLLGCMSFGVRSIVTSHEITQGWYYLLKESLGRSKHLKFKFTKPTSRHDPCRRSKSRDRMNRRRSARSDSSNSSLSSSLYRTKVARNTPRRYDIRHDDVNHVTSLKKRRRISNGFEEFKRPSINQSKAVAVGCHDNHHVNGLFVPKVVVALERKSRDVMNHDVTKVGKTPTGRRNIRRKDYSPNDVMISRLNYCVDYDVDDDVFETEAPMTSPVSNPEPTIDVIPEVTGQHNDDFNDATEYNFNPPVNTEEKLSGNTATPIMTKQRRLSLDSLLKSPFIGNKTIDNLLKVCDVIHENDVKLEERFKSKPNTLFGLKSWLPMQRKHDEAKPSKSLKEDDHTKRGDFERKKFRRSLTIRRSKRNPTNEINQPSSSLALLLTRKDEVAAFRSFLQSEFSEENLNFWLECENYKQTKQNKIRKTAVKIYEQYLAVGSSNEINVDARTRDTVKANLSNPNIEIFNQAQTRIFKLMESDSFRRFRLKMS